jgi:hypothetical protein
MDAQPIDPRDITWEVDYPTYRVTFWRRDGSASDEWRLTDAINVHEVLAWADARVEAGWTYQVFIETAATRGLGTLRVVGPNPSASDSPPR